MDVTFDNNFNQLLEIETVLSKIETSLLEIKTALSEIETSLLEIKTALSEIERVWISDNSGFDFNKSQNL